jgi:hypothetical protein
MARFITRIQLQQATEDDYKSLQKELNRESFKSSKNTTAKSKTSIGTNGEFSLEGNITIQQVTHAVVKAVSKTGKKYSFTIIRDKPVYS